VASLAVLAAIASAPAPASAGFLDFLFGSLQAPPSRSPVLTSYAEPAPVAPPLGPESLRQSVAPTVSAGAGGFGTGYCVRLCDGYQFPLQRNANATPVETCRSMCPAARTKVFFGADIDHAVARDGARYSETDNAYVYRKHLVANCTCNGHDAFGLARFDLSSDPTLKPGDIVATATGFKTFTGRRGGTDAFTPADPAMVTAALHPAIAPGAARVRFARRNSEAANAAAVDESPPDLAAVGAPPPREAKAEAATAPGLRSQFSR
jgi:hypothetical protein